MHLENETENSLEKWVRSKMKKIPFAAEAYKVSQYPRVIDYWGQTLGRAFQCFFVQLQQ